MTKTATVTTQSTASTAIGQDVLNDGEGLLAIAQAEHWAFVNRRVTHLCLATGGDTWDDYPASSCSSAPDDNAVPTLNAIATGSAVTWIDTDIWIDADTAALGELELSAQCYIPTASNTVRVTFTLDGGLGSVTPFVDCTTANSLPAANNEQTTTTALTSVTAGDEWVRLRVSIQRTVGAGTTNELRHVGVNEAELDITSVPDPEDS